MVTINRRPIQALLSAWVDPLRPRREHLLKVSTYNFGTPNR